MNIKCGYFELLKKIIEKKKRIVLFGAGAIGQVIIPRILQELGLLDYVDCYLDNDESKWGTYISTYGNKFEVKSPLYLKQCTDKTVIMINISRFSEVIKQLEKMPITKNMDCYIMPMMLIHNFCLQKSKGIMLFENRPLIPKKLHYMWLGGTAIPDNLKKCIDSWRRYCPDYEIIQWNESNYDLEKHSYMKDAYKEKAYGFVPDYARLDILYNEGGFYLDTDVEIRRPIDDLRYLQAFCGVEKWQIINFGGLSGAIKGHPMIKEFLDARESINFYNKDGSLNKNTCGYYDTQVAIRKGYKINGETQNIEGMSIVASDYFHPFDYMSGIVNETDNTHSIHWFNGGWLDEKMKKANEESKRMYMDFYKDALAKQVIDC